MKKLVVCVFLLFTFFAFQSQARIEVNKLTSYTVPHQGILPNTYDSPRHSYSSVVGENALSEGYIIIMGLEIARTTPPASGEQPPVQYLTGITVNIVGDLYFDSLVITDRSGKILGVWGAPRGATESPPNGAATISVDRQPIPTVANNTGNSYFVAIRTVDWATNGTSSTFSVNAGGVTVTPIVTLPTPDLVNNALTTDAITCELLITDLLPLSCDNHSSAMPNYPSYNQWQPGEQIRPRYDRDDYEYCPAPFKHTVPQVLPWEIQTAVLSIACSQRNVTANGTPNPNINNPYERLSSITLTVTAGNCGAANFDPNKTFRINTDPQGQTGPHGISLWRDSNGNGVWDPAVDRLVATIPFSGGFVKESENQWSLYIEVSDSADSRLEEVLETPTNVDDFFIVVEQRSDSEDMGYRPKMGQDYKIWIKPGDVTFGPIARPLRYAGIDISQVKTIYNNLYLEDISQQRVDPVEITAENDMTYNIIPVMGINIDTGGTRYNFTATKIQSIKVEILSIEDFDPNSDLAPLTDSSSSGISLWRDNKTTGNKGSFDAEDTFIAVTPSSWIYEGRVYDNEFGSYVAKYSTTLSLQTSAEDQGFLYPQDYASSTTYPHGGTVNNKYTYAGTDFFIALRTSKSLSYGSRFRLKIPYEGLWTTAVGKQAYNTLPILTREIAGNVFAKITSLTGPGNPGLEPSSGSTPVFKVELNDNLSEKTPRIKGLTVEFYDRGNFNLNDLASFEPLYPRFNSTTGWYDITYFNTAALKGCGVVVYNSAVSGGIDYNNPIMIGRYRNLSWPGAPIGYQFEFLNTIDIPATLYVAIRTSSTFTRGDSFDAGIVSWGLDETSWNTWGSCAIPVVDINSLSTTSYSRCQSGIFNPSGIGVINLRDTSRYEYIRLDWTNATNISPDSFVRYEILRNGVVISEITDRNQTWYMDKRDATNPPVDGVEYQYSINMVYYHAGSQTTFPSNTVTAKILGFSEQQLPTDFTLAAGTSSVTLMWVDRSYIPGNSSTYNNRAHRFRLKRTNLADDTSAETIVVSKWLLDNPYNIYYEVIDRGFPSSSGLQPGVYLYELYLQKNVPAGGISESRAVTGEPDPIAVYREDQPENGGGGGCFIATAVYGTEMAKEVIALKRFRDNYLMNNRAGQAFVRWYYKHSPPVANFIRDKKLLKATVRVGLRPLLWLATYLETTLIWKCSMVLIASFLCMAIRRLLAL